MNRRIVVPLDGSAVAEAALPLARGLVHQIGARVTLLRVLEVPSSFGHHARTPDREPASIGARPGPYSGITTQSPYGNWIGWSTNEPSARQIEQVANETAASERYLAAIAETFDTEHVETVVRLGHPAERILEAAESRDNAMIVLASHGRSGIGRAVIGSIAARVVQAARNPVFVVRATNGRSGAGSIDPISRILIPVDGSVVSEQAIPVITELFGGDEPLIHLLHVIETPRFANVAQSEGYVRWLAEKVGHDGLKATSEVAQGGNASDHIKEVARKQVVDLIAMSTHGRTGLDRFVLGSVAERVLHSAELPLLLVPARSS